MHVVSKNQAVCITLVMENTSCDVPLTVFLRSDDLHIGKALFFL